jgi:hypothetical protein
LTDCRRDRLIISELRIGLPGLNIIAAKKERASVSETIISRRKIVKYERRRESD